MNDAPLNSLYFSANIDDDNNLIAELFFVPFVRSYKI